MQNVCIIGSGHVGLVTGACLAELGNKVICVDNDVPKIEGLKNNEIIEKLKVSKGTVTKCLQESFFDICKNIDDPTAVQSVLDELGLQHFQALKKAQNNIV